MKLTFKSKEGAEYIKSVGHYRNVKQAVEKLDYFNIVVDVNGVEMMVRNFENIIMEVFVSKSCNNNDSVVQTKFDNETGDITIYGYATRKTSEEILNKINEKYNVKIKSIFFGEE